MANHFRRELLPSPKLFYEAERGQLSRSNRGGWCTVKSGCAFHVSDRHKPSSSFRVNVHSGAFRCFHCDAHGADVVAFVMLRDGLSFPEACKRLGCWDAREVSPAEQRAWAEREREQRRQRELAQQREIDAHEARVAARNRLHLLERLYLQANQRLSQLRQGQPEKYRGEQELCWWFLVDSWQRIGDAAAQYALLAEVQVGDD